MTVGVMAGKRMTEMVDVGGVLAKCTVEDCHMGVLRHNAWAEL